MFKLEFTPKQKSLSRGLLRQVGWGLQHSSPQLSSVFLAMPRLFYLSGEWLWTKLIVHGSPAKQSMPTVLMVERV